MKHFIDIENLREQDIDLGGGVVRRNNVGTFEIGDQIIIQEKFDGSCASFCYENGELKAFSRKHELDYQKTLNGFWNYVQSLNPEEYKDDANYIYFGEWTNKNKIIYFEQWNKHFLCFDIFDNENKCWMPQKFVKQQCEKHNLNYIHTFYEGEFISWDHVKSFMNSPQYGDTQEGCVCKNQSKLNDPDCRNPFYLKVVNDAFKESMKTRVKVIDPEKEAEKQQIQSLIESIVTKNRVEKMLHKLVDEGILPQEITPKDMGTVARNLPKRIFEDCIKEEPEIMQAAGEYGGKMCSATTMKIAKEIVLG